VLLVLPYVALKQMELFSQNFLPHLKLLGSAGEIHGPFRDGKSQKLAVGEKSKRHCFFGHSNFLLICFPYRRAHFIELLDKWVSRLVLHDLPRAAAHAGGVFQQCSTAQALELPPPPGGSHDSYSDWNRSDYGPPLGGVAAQLERVDQLQQSISRKRFGEEVINADCLRHRLIRSLSVQAR